MHNLFADMPLDLSGEHFAVLLETVGLRIERIVSIGQATPPDAWYDQDRPEWVVLLQGAAGLLIEGEAAERVLKPGDWVSLPAHLRHRVTWTQAGQATVWLAVHYAD